MSFFKFLKKGKRGEGRDLDAAMSWEDIPPAPKPFEMAPSQPADQFNMPEMPDISNIGEAGEDVEIPAVPDIGDIEKTISPPKITADKSKDEKFFEDIPFPGVGRRDFGSSKIELAPPRAFEPPQPTPVPQVSRTFEAPKPITPPEIMVEPSRAPEPVKIAKEEEHAGEFKYLKERVNVDFSQSLYFNLEQCETITNATNDIRRQLADYEESYQKLCDSLSTSDKQFQKWRLALEDALKKLFEIDKSLFKAG
jgi:hypothetical protein